MSAAAVDIPKPGPLGEKQLNLIKSAAPALEANIHEIARRFYKAMLAEHPYLKNTFNHSKQEKGEQPDVLARAVYGFVANIEDPTPIIPFIERIAHKHTSLSIQPEHYKIVGKYLTEAAVEVLGADVLQGELYDAWLAAYWQLAHIFIDREAELYATAAWLGWKDFVVSKKVKESDDITSFYLVPKDGVALPSYKPGQFISVQRFIEDLGYKQSRQYSLSDSPNSKHFRISVRRDQGNSAQKIPGMVSNRLHNTLNEGDTVEVAFPYGEFYLDDTNSPVVLISAGVGLTPLTSMLHAVIESPKPREISWIQGVHSRSAHALNEEVIGLLNKHPNPVKKAIFYSDPHDALLGKHYDFPGRMDLNKVDDTTLRLADSTTQYYVCGPEGFMQEIGKALKDRGVDVRRVHAEVFSAAANPLE